MPKTKKQMTQARGTVVCLPSAPTPNPDCWSWPPIRLHSDQCELKDTKWSHHHTLKENEALPLWALSPLTQAMKGTQKSCLFPEPLWNHKRLEGSLPS